MKQKLTRVKPISELYHYTADNKIHGMPPGLRGDCSGLRGNIDDCWLTYGERRIGVKIQKLVKEAAIAEGERTG